jgi:hypothetical protein
MVNYLEPVTISMTTASWIVLSGTCHRSLKEISDEKIAGLSRERLKEQVPVILEAIVPWALKRNPESRNDPMDVTLARIDWLLLHSVAKECANREPLLEEPVFNDFTRRLFPSE